MWLKYLSIILLSPNLFLFSQDSYVDSLKSALKTAKNDTARCNILVILVQNTIDVELTRNTDELKKIVERNVNSKGLSAREQRIYKLSNAVVLNQLGLDYEDQGDLDKALECYEKSLKIDEALADVDAVATDLNNIATIYHDKGEMNKALEYYLRSLNMRSVDADKKGLAYTLNNIGFIYEDLGEIANAVDYYGRSLKILEAISDKRGIANGLNNLAGIYNGQNDNAKALEYYQKSLAVSEEIHDRKAIGNALNNIGYFYQLKGDPSVSSAQESRTAGVKKALDYYLQGLSYRRAVGDQKAVANSLNNLGHLYSTFGDALLSSKEVAQKKADSLFHECLRLREEIGDKRGTSNTLNNLARLYFNQKKFKLALDYSTRSKTLAMELHTPDIIQSSSLLLRGIYSALGDYKQALENYELAVSMRDSLNNESTRRASVKSQLKYEYEKRAAADSVAHAKESEIKSAELSRQSAELKAKKNQQYALFGGLALVMVFAGFMYNRFKITQKQKEIIEQQKEEVEEQKKLVEEKQREVLDSIKYARRIQLAQIPSEKRVNILLAKVMRG